MGLARSIKKEKHDEMFDDAWEHCSRPALVPAYFPCGESQGLAGAERRSTKLLSFNVLIGGRVKFTIFVPVEAQDRDQLKATIKSLFPGSDSTTTERATGTTIVIDWKNLDALADPLEEPNQAQREIDPQELLSQVSAKSTECDVCESPEGPFIVVEVSNGKGPTRWFAVCSDECLQVTLQRCCLSHYLNYRNRSKQR
jgi:hypothetical protein